jgi:hypothetical protein
MSELEKHFCNDDLLFMDKIIRRMDHRRIVPEFFVAVGGTAAKFLLKTGEILAANYSLDEPRRDGDDLL